MDTKSPIPPAALYIAVVISMALAIVALVRNSPPSSAEAPDAADPAVAGQIQALNNYAVLSILADDAIANGNRISHQTLEATYAESSNSNEIRNAANARIMQIQMFYLQSSNLLPKRIPVRIDDTVFNIDERLDSASLISVVASQQHSWQYTRRAAMLLANRPTTEAVDALASVIKTDPHLAVVYQATASFKLLTGCPSTKVFGGSDFGDWLAQNRDAVNTRLAAIIDQASTGASTSTVDSPVEDAPPPATDTTPPAASPTPNE